MYYFLKVLYKSLIYYCYVVLAAFMYNNCKALRAGKYSYDHLGHPALLGPVERGSGSSMGKAAVISVVVLVVVSGAICHNHTLKLRQ